ncbi:MAG: hypothetical protein HYY16_03080 [Planctomycetes bacterium]|nr:hypothetical protein [Planctomycetota bacterium]
MRRVVLCFVCVLAGASAVQAQPSAARRAVQELLRYLETRFAREVAEEGIERLEGRLVRMVEAYGDDAVAAIRRVGPRVGTAAIDAHGAPAARLLAKWGDDGARLLADEGATAARVFSRYGDEAVEVMLRHRGVGGRIVEELGEDGVWAARGLGPDGGVQLASLAPQVRATGRAGEILAVVERFGDRACAFLWRHKGVIFGGALLAAFLSDPEPYLSGVKDLVVEPAAELGAEAARRTDWTAVIVAGMVLGVVLIAFRWLVAARRA